MPREPSEEMDGEVVNEVHPRPAFRERRPDLARGLQNGSVLLEMAVRWREGCRAHQVLFQAEMGDGMRLEGCQRRFRSACVTDQETLGDFVELLVGVVQCLVAKKARVRPDEAVVVVAAGSVLFLAL